MRKDLTPAQRVMVAADFKPEGDGPDARAFVWAKVLKLARALKGTGVTLKVNSALRANGFALIDLIHEHDLEVFADLKLYDIPETLATDGALLRSAKPELVTAACVSGVEALTKLQN